MTTLPRPSHVALANDTDNYIRALAYAIDSQLGKASRVALLTNVGATTDANGAVIYPFPTLGQITGAIIVPFAFMTAQGNVTAMPPVPPASIGRVIPATSVALTLVSLGVGSVTCRAMTTPWDNGVYQGQTQQYGTQPVRSGVTVTASGVAWGPVI